MPVLPKVILFDADGVLILSDRPYSHQHAEEHNIEAEQIEPFFRGEFGLARIGKADVRDLITKHRELWAWNGTPEALLERWFKAESTLDQKLVKIIQQLRLAGVKCYLATDQEQRANYFREHLFHGLLDGIFVSCELGVEKKDPQFFKLTLAQLSKTVPGLRPDEATFFDDSHDKIESGAAAGLHSVYYTSRDQVAALIPAASRDPA